MRKVVKKTKGLIKGAPTAVVVSAAIHAALLLLAGGLVVFNIIKKEQTQFVPHKIERTKMPLKKLRVKVKQTVKPKRATERITSTKRSNVMPDIQLPAMSAMGSGLDDGIGGFAMMNDLSQMGLMGTGRSVGNDFEGTFYYLMHKRNGTDYPGMSNEAGADTPGSGLFGETVREFITRGWDTKVLDPFWRSPDKLYATQIFVPIVSSALAPEKFGDKTRNEAAFWLVHYKGEIGHKEGGRFRFWGWGDDVLIARVNNKIVFDGCWEWHYDANLTGGWRTQAEDDVHRKYTIGIGRFKVGDWFELKPGEPVPMEVLIGEIPGGGFAAVLCVEQEGVDYPEREEIPGGGPLLPIFKTMATPEHLIDEIKYYLPEGQVDLYGGPIFSAY